MKLINVLICLTFASNQPIKELAIKFKFDRTYDFPHSFFGKEDPNALRNTYWKRGMRPCRVNYAFVDESLKVYWEDDKGRKSGFAPDEIRIDEETGKVYLLHYFDGWRGSILAPTSTESRLIWEPDDNKWSTQMFWERQKIVVNKVISNSKDVSLKSSFAIKNGPSYQSKPPEPFDRLSPPSTRTSNTPSSASISSSVANQATKWKTFLVEDSSKLETSQEWHQKQIEAHNEGWREIWLPAENKFGSFHQPTMKIGSTLMDGRAVDQVLEEEKKQPNDWEKKTDGENIFFLNKQTSERHYPFEGHSTW